MSLPRRALIAITSATAPLGKDGDVTGLFITEALHPFNVLRSAGFEVDFASETGKYTPDALSLTQDFLNGDDLLTWEDEKSDFRQKLDNMVKASELDPTRYGIFFASAGHAALIDYPKAKYLQRIASTVWNTGGVAAAVCHGAVVFSDVRDKQGKLIVEGKRMTGFTNEGEDALGVMQTLKSWGHQLPEEFANGADAKCESPSASRLPS